MLVAGGSDERDWDGITSRDPNSEEFVATAPLNNKRFKLPAETVPLPTGRLLLAGGSKRVEVYDPGSASFLVAIGQMSGDWHFMNGNAFKGRNCLIDGRVR